MILDVFATDEIVRERAGEKSDGRGGKVADWSDAAVSKLPVDGCSALPGTSDELVAHRDATLIQWTIYAPPDIDVVSTDRIRYRGAVYAIDGQPQVFANGLGFLDQTVLLLKRWEG